MELKIIQVCLALSCVQLSSATVCSTDTSEYTGSPIRSIPYKRHQAKLYFGHISDIFGSREKRSRPEPFFPENPLPWSCTSETVWRDLGEFHFPRFIREIRCSQRYCWYDHYSCIPQTVSMKILTPNNDDCVDATLPSTLRTTWRFVNVQVTVGCYCSR